MFPERSALTSAHRARYRALRRAAARIKRRLERQRDGARRHIARESRTGAELEHVISMSRVVGRLLRYTGGLMVAGHLDATVAAAMARTSATSIISVYTSEEELIRRLGTPGLKRACVRPSVRPSVGRCVAARWLGSLRAAACCQSALVFRPSTKLGILHRANLPLLRCDVVRVSHLPAVIESCSESWGPTQALGAFMKRFASDHPSTFESFVCVAEKTKLLREHTATSCPAFLLYRNGVLLASVHGVDPPALLAALEAHVPRSPEEPDSQEVRSKPVTISFACVDFAPWVSG